MAAKQVLPGLYRIPFNLGPIPYTTGYLIEDGDELVLVDTGIPGKAAAIAKLLASIRRGAGDVKHILITHHHYDHTGNLAWLFSTCPRARKAASGCTPGSTIPTGRTSRSSADR